MTSRQRIWVWVITSLFVLTAVSGEDGSPPERISLEKIQVAGWQPARVESYVGKKLYDAIDGYADFHMGFNFKDSERRSFSNGEKRIEIFSYRFDTPENAFGLFSVMRMGSVEFLNLGNETSLEGRVFHIWKGPYYVTITDLGKEGASEEEMVAFAKVVDSQFSRHCAKPFLVEALPNKSLLPHSVTYFHYRHALEKLTYLGEENVLQLGDDFDKPYDVEAAYGQFLIDKSKYDLIVLRYESPKKPDVAAQKYIESMKNDLKTSSTNWPWAELVERNGKQTIIFREGNVLMLSFPTTNGNIVRDLMKQVAANLKGKKG